jgi:hypothetical protein
MLDLLIVLFVNYFVLDANKTLYRSYSKKILYFHVLSCIFLDLKTLYLGILSLPVSWKLYLFHHFGKIILTQSLQIC